MTREETIKILAILKAAYPNSYKNMTKEEANGTVTIWAMQFATMPAEVVMLAINKLISTSPFPPAICEVKNKISGLYWESWEALRQNKEFKTLTPEQEAVYQRIYDAAESLRNCGAGAEPSLQEMIEGANNQFLIGSNKEIL